MTTQEILKLAALHAAYSFNGVLWEDLTAPEKKIFGSQSKWESYCKAAQDAVA